MREIPVNQIRDVVAELCGRTNIQADPLVLEAIKKHLEIEESRLSREVLQTTLENAEVARRENLPLCQDTGMVVVFLEIGQDVHLSGGDVNQAVNEGVRRGYKQWFLRKSVVADPLLRENTGDNTPAVIHSRLVPGDQVAVTVVPRGFGGENMSALAMLKPSDGEEGIKRFVIDTVRRAGADACPPLIVGVGIGGTFEKAALLSKEALTIPLGTSNEIPHLRRLEDELVAGINALGIGPQGLGGAATTLAVHIRSYPTHIAGLPVAVNLSCHVYRHGTKIL